MYRAEKRDATVLRVMSVAGDSRLDGGGPF